MDTPENTTQDAAGSSGDTTVRYALPDGHVLFAERREIETGDEHVYVKVDPGASERAASIKVPAAEWPMILAGLSAL